MQFLPHKMAAGTAQSIQRLGYGAGWEGNRIPVGARFSPLAQTGSENHPDSYTMCTGSLSWGVKRSGRVVDHLRSSSAETEERVEL